MSFGEAVVLDEEPSIGPNSWDRYESTDSPAAGGGGVRELSDGFDDAPYGVANASLKET